MIEIITGEPPQNQININKATYSTDFYYGVYFRGEKGFILQRYYKDGPFRAVSNTGITHHNEWTSFESPTIRGLVKTLIEENFKVFIFDNHKEFYTWLAD